MIENIGDLFQQETKYRRAAMPVGGLDWANQPQRYKEYPASRKVKLPNPPPVAVPLQDLLAKRRSVRAFAPKPMTTLQLSGLLWASTGIQRREQGAEFRTAPSAGALYPIETYVVANRVDTVPSGLYHYSIQRHVLEELRLSDLGPDVARAALEQRMCAEAAAVLVWTAIFRRSKWKYRQRAYRYVYLDAGHIAQNFALVAVALGLGSCQIGAIFDDEINQILGVDGVEESVIYMSVAGTPVTG